MEINPDGMVHLEPHEELATELKSPTRVWDVDPEVLATRINELKNAQLSYTLLLESIEGSAEDRLETKIQRDIAKKQEEIVWACAAQIITWRAFNEWPQ